MKLCIGLVIKGNEQFIDDWLKSAERIGEIFLIIDNGVSEEGRKKLINHPKTKQYLIQKNMGRNQSRDYQRILEMAREENCQWVFNIDSDEYVPDLDYNNLFLNLLNWTSDSVGLPLFEMRGDKNHFVMIEDKVGEMKHARLVHKIYKVLSHFEFNKRDVHGRSIPHNCTAGGFLNLPIQHFGHMTKKLRDEKRKQYITKGRKDKVEHLMSWMEEDKSKITIKPWSDIGK